MKINRWWYSKKQKEIETLFSPLHVCQVFINDEWHEFTEWTTSLNGKCNCDDAILIAESVTELPIMVNGIKQN